jgi:hypothetical protein
MKIIENKIDTQIKHAVKHRIYFADYGTPASITEIFAAIEL